MSDNLRKARRVAYIFNLLAKVVGVMGGVIATVIFLAGFGDAGQPLFYTAVAIVIGTSAALGWAGLTLSAIVAEYIADRTMETRTPQPQPQPTWLYPPQPQQPQPGPQWKEEQPWAR